MSLTRSVMMLAALAAGFVVSIWLDRPAAAPIGLQQVATSAVGDEVLPATLLDLVGGKLPLVDLSWPLNRDSAYWPGENYKPFELHTIATLQQDGVLSKAFSSPEHLGTHLDAPNHFEAGKPSVDQLPAESLFGPGVKIDVSGPVLADPDYLISLDDVRQFESEHGRIPDRAIVLADTGWSKFWHLPDRYQNRDIRGRLHFPGFSAEAVEFLITERNIRGIGLDTLSVDRGTSRDFPVHHLLGKAERFGLENLAQLDKLPAVGFFLFVAPMKIETGTGGPARVFAVLPKNDDES